MDKNIIPRLLQAHETITSLEIAQIEKLIKLFPYCEVTRIIDLLFKKKNNDLLFEKKLSENIIHMCDREFLFSLLNKSSTKKNKIKKDKDNLKKKSFNDWLKKPINNTNFRKNSKRQITHKIYTKNNDDLMTETLAKLYIEQKHFDQAIRAYEILSLKYPKKSSFFVREIEKIKQLILINDE